MKSYLNLGCGDRFSTDWTNVDFVSTNRDVIQYDLRKGIPFGDSQFEVVYHSHILEHFPKNLAPPFLRECHRVLKEGGIIRLAVPDLQRMAQLYLELLDKAEAGDEVSKLRYEWVLLEMYDQTVREFSGGAMGDYLKQAVIPEKEFVLSRIGNGGRREVESKQRTPIDGLRHEVSTFVWRGLKRVRRAIAASREIAARGLLRDQYELLRLGRFRRGGEPHLWMYDRYSIKQLLIQSGFCDLQALSAVESKIPNWANYNLDTNPDGAIYKPDSIYVEAYK